MRNLVSLDNIRVENLTFDDDHEHRLFDETNVELPMGEIVNVVGPTGCGKSLFLKILAGLVWPKRGSIWFNGVAINELSFDEFIPYRLNIGYSFEYGGLIHNKTLKENLMLPLQYHPDFNLSGGEERIDHLMERFGLGRFKNKRPSDVPGSFRKVTILLRAFSLHPEFLILDDPSIGLTRELKQKLKDLIYEQKELGYVKHVIMVSNDHHFTDDLVTKRMLLQDKKLWLEDLSENKKVAV